MSGGHGRCLPAPRSSRSSSRCSRFRSRSGRPACARASSFGCSTVSRRFRPAAGRSRGRRGPPTHASVADEQHAHLPSPGGAEDVYVARVRELLLGVGDREPAGVVDLPRRPKPSGPGPHQPVADELLPSGRVEVGGALQLRHELTDETRLLLDLAQGALLVALPVLRLALGKGPVVVLGAVDDHHLRHAVPVANDDSAGGAHPFEGLLHGGLIVALRGGPPPPRFRLFTNPATTSRPVLSTLGTWLPSAGPPSPP